MDKKIPVTVKFEIKINDQCSDPTKSEFFIGDRRLGPDEKLPKDFIPSDPMKRFLDLLVEEAVRVDLEKLGYNINQTS